MDSLWPRPGASYRCDADSSGNIVLRLPDATGMPGEFLLDTGSGQSVLSSRAASRPGLIHVPPGQPGGNAQAETAVVSLRLGAEVRAVPTLVAPDDELLARSSLPLDGVLGGDALATCGVYIDMSAGSVDIIDPPSATADIAWLLDFDTADQVPGCKTDHNRMLVPVTVNGMLAADLVIDTACGYTCVPAAVASAAGLTMVRQGTLDFPEGKALGCAAIAKTLRVGSVVFKDVDVRYRTGGDPAGCMNVLGRNVIGGCKLLLDYPAAVAYMRRATPDQRAVSGPLPSTTPREPACACKGLCYYFADRAHPGRSRAGTACSQKPL